jgi:hypothetical protein
MSAVRYRLVPPAKACVRWGILTIGMAVVISVAFTTIIRLSRGVQMPPHWTSGWLKIVGFSAALGAALGLLIYGIGLVWGATISEHFLCATNYWGKKVRVPWSSITKVERTTVQGLPALLVHSSAVGSALYVYTLGLKLPEVYEKLCETAGPNNPLTRCFAPSAT